MKAPSIPIDHGPDTLNHDWSLTPREAVARQRELAASVRLEPLEHEPATVAGVDVSIRRKENLAAAAVVVVRLSDLAVIEYVRHECEVPFPYVPGLLSFREIPALLPAIEQIESIPDVWMVDGQGIAHPRRFGLAAHLGVVLGRPCFGVAKTRLTGTYDAPDDKRGARADLLDEKTGECIGAVVRTRAGVKPIFVSAGHQLTLEDAIRLTMASAPRYRLPEPARLAHRLSKYARI